MFRIADGEPLGYDDPRAARALDRVPDQRRGPGAELPARPGHDHRVGSAVRTRRPARRRVPSGHDGAAGVRLADRQADRDRGRPRRRPWSAPGARWPSSRSAACPPCCHSTGRSWTIPRSPATSFTVHTRWIETEFGGDVRAAAVRNAAVRGRAETPARETITVEVGGKRLEVVVPADVDGPPAPPSCVAPRGGARRSPGRGAAGSGDSLVSPMQGTIVKIVAAEGTAGDARVTPWWSLRR